MPRRNQDKHPWDALAVSRIPIANMVLLGTEEKGALVPTCTEPTKMARVDLRELRNGGRQRAAALKESVPARACGGGKGWRGIVEHRKLGL
jgi:hypothetical protein